MNKLAKLISELSLEEVKLIKKDLDSGNINKIVDKKLSSEKGKETSVCPVCGMVVRRDSGFYLEFGKEIRKKAHFDELDCLNYFLDRIK